MNAIRRIKHIQIKQISYCPELFDAIMTMEIHPTEYDESDDLEYQKTIINELISYNWFIDKNKYNSNNKV
jgi:hypothetical protein